MPYKDPAKKREADREARRRYVARHRDRALESMYRSRKPEQHRARMALLYAKRHGHITQQPCEVCGNEKSEAHHEDYSKPLEVRWLCRLHHMGLHAQDRAQQKGSGSLRRLKTPSIAAT